ncbi:MAG: helix-turn-helix domain-containing protein [Bacteriovoracales bacterium]|nr:helix-turn-helix domain-containing protein [Bacteriovoracales bacterium]
MMNTTEKITSLKKKKTPSGKKLKEQKEPKVRKEQRESAPKEGRQSPPNAPKNQSLGQYLFAIRKEKKINLKKIAVDTRINYKILSALESDSLEDLPDRTYLRGFIRCLSKELQINEDRPLSLLDQLLKQRESKTNKTRDPQYAKATSPSLIAPSSSFAIDISSLDGVKGILDRIPQKRLLIVVLVVFGMGSFLLNKILTDTKSNMTANISVGNKIQDLSKKTSESQEKGPALTATEKETSDPPKVPSKDDHSLQEPSPTSTNHSAMTKEKEKAKAKKDETVKTQENDKLDPDSKNLLASQDPPLEFTKMQYPLYSLDSKSPKLQDETLFPKKAKRAYSPGKEYVFIRASRGDSWLVYQSSKTSGPKSFTLEQGEFFSIKGEEIRLFLGNINAVDIFYNNQYLQTKSSSGVKSLVFPHELAKTSQIPLFIYDKIKGDHHSTWDMIGQTP